MVVIFHFDLGVGATPVFAGTEEYPIVWMETDPGERRNETDWGLHKMFQDFLSHLGMKKTF